MHFHTAFCFVVSHSVFDVREIEIAIQFAIDAREKILVKCGGNARRVVVSREQLRHGLFEVGGEQERVAFAQHVANVAEKLVSGGPVEIPNRTSEEKNQ